MIRNVEKSFYAMVETIERLKKEYKELPNVLPIKKWFEKLYGEWNDYTREKELVDATVLPFWHNKYKYDKWVIRNYRFFTAFRMWSFAKAGFDYVASITATEGKGKSTLALHLVKNLKLLGWKFTPETLIFRATPAEHVVNIIRYKKEHVLWFDEAKAFFEKREFFRKRRIELLKELTAQRKNRNVYLLLLGNWEELDIYFRERRLRESIIVVDKGVYTSLFNSSILGIGYDVFFMERFKSITKYMPFDYINQMNELMRLPSNIGTGIYPPITGKAWKKYLELKELLNVKGDPYEEKQTSLVEKGLLDE